MNLTPFPIFGLYHGLPFPPTSNLKPLIFCDMVEFRGIDLGPSRFPPLNDHAPNYTTASENSYSLAFKTFLPDIFGTISLTTEMNCDIGSRL